MQEFFRDLFAAVGMATSDLCTATGTSRKRSVDKNGNHNQLSTIKYMINREGNERVNPKQPMKAGTLLFPGSRIRSISLKAVTLPLPPLYPSHQAPFEVQKRLDEVRLLESRKSARLADVDTDFARLADMGSDRKRTASHTIDVPAPSPHLGSRKRRPSSSQDDSPKDTQMDECSAALVLMSLSCSPHSPNLNGFPWLSTSPDSSIGSSSASYRSTPSPPPRAYTPPFAAPLSSSSVSDEGIVMDYYPDELPRKKKNVTRIVFQCTWPSCLKITNTCESIEAHVRNDHLNPRRSQTSMNKIPSFLPSLL
ncbi:hypothetical protein Zmor_012513 [Zophobas morio]|uniref:C2H2-type domain-containing protein n=1 Tax=Zophobas morio TaxID=2755281 RepID=A0AA38IBM4_9CUCU|nr:hypothetical protein Zmor_012513 [Zophobas morio]